MQTAKRVTKPTKQRKRLYDAPAHMRHKLLAAHLSSQLRASHGVKNLPVRSGDTIRVVRGDHKGVEGKITRVNMKKYRIYVDGLTREKVDGTTISVPIHPSKVMIVNLNLDDKWRKKILERKKTAQKQARKAEEAPKKPKAKPEEKPKEIPQVKEVVQEKAPVAKEKLPKKKITRARKKAAPKKAAAEKAKAEPEKAVKEEKPKAEKRKTRRKTTKKTQKGGE